MLTVQRLIAMRYFVLGKRRSWTAFIPALVIAALLLTNWLVLPWVANARSPRGMDFRAQYLQLFQASRLGLIVLLTVVLYVAIPKGLFPTQDTGQLQARIIAAQRCNCSRVP